ncbi:MAG: hypothetical protein ABSD77_05480 [Verrucomicrobiota bacterium]|jgi:hypothetical protein
MGNRIKEVLEYYGRARHRAGRRKSAWNAFLIPFSLVAWAGIWYLLFRLVWLFHVAFHPDHELTDFWQKDIGFRNGVLSFLMVFSLVPGAGTLGFVLTNIFFRLIPWARRAFDAEAKDYPGTSFRKSMRGLYKICIWTLPSGLLIAFIAAYFLKSLK